MATISTTDISNDTITLTGSTSSTCYITSPYTVNVGTGITAGATVGGYLTSSGSSYTTSWTMPNSNFHDGNNTVLSIPHDSKKVILEEEATLEVKGKLKVNGVDLEERLTVIEQVLSIPTRDVAMEDKHPKLKQLYEQYMRELEKYKTWDRIKGEE